MVLENREKTVESLINVLGDYSVNYFSSREVDLKEVLAAHVDEGNLQSTILDECQEALK